MNNIEFQNIELTQKLLTRIKGIEFVTFTKEDVVRHPLVSNIIDAYEKNKN